MKKRISPYKKLVEKEISGYISRDVDELYGPLKDLFSRGGKRMRPVLCMVSCEAVGGDREDAVKTAAAIEMVHNFTLIHDDIADKSELRRGKPCLHHKYGLGIAINAGDGLFAAAYEVLCAAVSKSGKEGVGPLLAGAITRVCEGQAMDIGWVHQKRWNLTEEDYFSMIRRKTGALLSVSCEVGGMLGGGPKKQINALKEFGMNLGVSFQIHDDVLNLRGDVKKYGKEIGGDINEGKRTLPVVYTLTVCTPDEKKRLINILDKERNSKEEIANAIEIMERYGSVERAASLAEGLIEKGKSGLRPLKKSDSKDLLTSLADYTVERQL